jgi:DNA helicase-4
MPPIIPILVALFVFLIHLWNRNEKRQRELEQQRLQEEQNREQQRIKRLDLFTEHLPAIKVAVQTAIVQSLGTNSFISHHQVITWQKRFTPLYNLVGNKEHNDLELSAKDAAFVTKFKGHFTNCFKYRDEYNKKFIELELNRYAQFFDNIEGRKLDQQQRTAIITDEDNNIVIAGAGSGKTTTIVGKVAYIIDKYKVSPEEILLISFTSKSAATLSNRINNSGVEVKTFHKFGKDVITEVDEKQPSIFDELQFKELITGFFKELLKDSSYLKKVIEYFSNFLKEAKSQDEFENQGAYIQYLKDSNFSTFKGKSIIVNGRTTFKREVVKSVEECTIANFLYFNGIEYEYEFPYIHDTATKAYRQYKPDFTLSNNGNTFYLEHFAIDKQGNVPPFFADKENGETIEQASQAYNEGIKWKRDLHTMHGTVLIETYSHEMKDKVLLDNLTKRLTDVGVKFFPKSDEEIWNIINEAAKDEVDGFVNLFQTFITLMKSNNYSIQDVTDKSRQQSDKFQKQRSLLFIEIITPIFERYQGYLSRRKEIDFSDMINIASRYIEAGNFTRKYKYVIVDEFQDISIGRYQLLKAIRNQNPECKLFCVGDDWQSIYRFTGSDIALFKDFEKYFGFTSKSKIETTYRFHNPIIEVSSSFILKNSNQTKKELKSVNPSKQTNYKVVYSISQDQDDTYALKSIFDELVEAGVTNKEILILGRYSFDLSRLKNNNGIFQIDSAKATVNYRTKRGNGEPVSIFASYMTVHKAKGLEADIVIVINCNAGKHGFPSGMSDDNVLNLLLSKADQFENGEERRLFYVAMTRSKEQVYFVADSTYKSKFITELEVGGTETIVKKCPKCLTADMNLKNGVTNGKQWAFYGCSNYMYGCDYREWV